MGSFAAHPFLHATNAREVLGDVFLSAVPLDVRPRYGTVLRQVYYALPVTSGIFYVAFVVTTFMLYVVLLRHYFFHWKRLLRTTTTCPHSRIYLVFHAAEMCLGYIILCFLKK